MTAEVCCTAAGGADCEYYEYYEYYVFIRGADGNDLSGGKSNPEPPRLLFTTVGNKVF